MDMYQKRKERKKQRENESADKAVNKNSINWYPGHMAKARREIQDSLKLVDVVIELIDARIPIASRNPVLNEIIGDKPRIIAINKSDLADSKMNNAWINKFKSENQIAILTDSNAGKGTNDVITAALEIMKEKIEKEKLKGRVGTSIKLMIVGIPNVGKSSFINKIAKKQTAMVGNKPGVTKKNQWIRLSENVQLLDTPGVLWPKLDNEMYARHLAYIGTIKDDILDRDELSFYLVKELYKKYKVNLFSRYKIDDDFSFENEVEILEEIGRKRGCLVKGNEIDYTKVANILIEDFRSGKLGKITLEV